MGRTEGRERTLASRRATAIPGKNPRGICTRRKRKFLWPMKFHAVRFAKCHVLDGVHSGCIKITIRPKTRSECAAVEHSCSPSMADAARLSGGNPQRVNPMLVSAHTLCKPAANKFIYMLCSVQSMRLRMFKMTYMRVPIFFSRGSAYAKYINQFPGFFNFRKVSYENQSQN